MRQQEERVSCVPREQLRTLFEIFDTERSGRIDARELRAALRALGLPLSMEQIRSLLSSCGGKGEVRTITFDTFCNIAEARLPERESEEAYRQIFGLFGGEESGFITIDHLEQICEELKEDIPRAELEEMINQADSDGDRKVTLEDFIRIMQLKNDPWADEEKRRW